MIEMGVKRPAKIMKLGKDEQLDEAVFIWFRQKMEDEILISGQILQAKALELYQQLVEAHRGESNSEFIASAGWLWRFCQCHGIQQLSLQGEKHSADQPAADSFVPYFQDFDSAGGYSIDQIFNCDESDLYYKNVLPSNANGSIKLPLLVMGKSKNCMLL